MIVKKLFLFILYSVLINQTIYSQVSAGSDFTICKCDGNTRLNGKYTGDPNVCVGGLKYKWISIPTDSSLLKNDSLLSPNICPKVKTKYKLTIDGNNDEVEVTYSNVDIDLDVNMDGNIDNTDDLIEEDKKGMVINVNNDKSDGTNMDMKDNTLKFADFQNDKDNYRIGKVIIRKTDIATGYKLVLKVSDKTKVRIFDQLIETGVNATEKIGPASTTIEYEIPKVDIQANDLNYWVETIDDGIFDITLELRNSGNMIICSDLIRVVGNIDKISDNGDRNRISLSKNQAGMTGLEAKLEGIEPLSTWVPKDKLKNFSSCNFWISLQKFTPSLYWMQSGNASDQYPNMNKEIFVYFETNTPSGHQYFKRIPNGWKEGVIKIDIIDTASGKVEAFIDGTSWKSYTDLYFKTVKFENYQLSAEQFQSINRNVGTPTSKAKVSEAKYKDGIGWHNTTFVGGDIQILWYSGELILNGNGEYNKTFINGQSYELWDKRDW